MSSRFVQVTVVPTATVNVDGPKLKLSIFTSALSAFCGATAAAFLGGAVRALAPKTTTARKTAKDTLLLMIFLLLFILLRKIQVCRVGGRRSPERRIHKRSEERRVGKECRSRW